MEKFTYNKGIIIGEGGSSSLLVANITDVDWNLDEVIVDLAPIGGGLVEMNDRGLDGDQSVGDDIFSTVISVPGLEIGLIEINITATDKFGISTVGTGQIEVVNQAPRLTSVEMSPSVGYRGTILVVNAEAYDGHGVGNVSVDLRSYGGELFYLTDNAGVWTGQITIPQGMPPGYQSVEFILQDGAGKVGTTSIWYQDQPDSQDPRGLITFQMKLQCPSRLEY